MSELWLRFAVSLAIGLLIGLERERNPAARAGVRTFALVALLGTLAAFAGELAAAAWTVPLGLVAVAGMLVASYARAGPEEDPGTTTVAAGAVCYLLGVLAALGDTSLAGALGIGVAALLYFKPEIEGFSLALKRHEQVSALQFLVASFIVLPILPDHAYGPYEVLNPRNVWLMVVLVSGIGLASHMALRIAGERHGVLLTGLLGGLISSTATTLLYARRSRESPATQRMAAAVLPLSNLVPLARVVLMATIVAPAIVLPLGLVLGAGLLGGLLLALPPLFRSERVAAAPAPESRNPAELGIALKFAALYALVLLASAMLVDFAGSRGLYAAAAASGLADIDPIVLSSLRLFGDARLGPLEAVSAIALACAANVVFKLGIVLWFDRHLARRVLAPSAAMLGAGFASWLLLRAA